MIIMSDYNIEDSEQVARVGEEGRLFGLPGLGSAPAQKNPVKIWHSLSRPFYIG